MRNLQFIITIIFVRYIFICSYFVYFFIKYQPQPNFSELNFKASYSRVALNKVKLGCFI